MSSCLIYYGTSEGQTRKIAERMAQVLTAKGLTVEVAESPHEVDLSQFDAVIVGDSIHIGRYHRHVMKFIRAHRETLNSMPSAFFSVCLAINSKKEDDRKQAQRFVDEMVERTGWRPNHVAVFAGALRYSEYGLLTRFIMKRISAAEGQVTDTSRDYEYTDWASVAAFAQTMADHLLDGRRVPTSGPATL